MPDGDVLSHHVRQVWRAAYEGLRGREEPSIVGDRVAGAICATLRKNGGVPALLDAIDLVAKVHSRELSEREALERARRLKSGSDHLSLLLTRAVQKCLSAEQSDTDIRHSVATVVVNELAETALFAKAAPLLIIDGVTAHEAREYITRCRNSAFPLIQRIAGQLAEKPNGDHYRKPPNRKNGKKETAALMDVSLLD